ADDAERLALPDREGDAVDRAHAGDLLLKDDPASHREVLLEVLDGEELFGHRPYPVDAIVSATSASASRRLVASSRWQAARWRSDPSTDAISGSVVRHTSIAYGQRRW